jgi:hypothetical protein
LLFGKIGIGNRDMQFVTTQDQLYFLIQCYQ